MSEARIKYLEMIQNIVNRMANTSFLLKGWCVTLVSALFALAAKDANPRYVIMSAFPAVMLFALDGYFLYQERLYRRLFDQARTNENADVDFSLSTRSLIGGTATWAWSVTSKTMLLFYGPIIATILIVMYWLCG